MVAPQRPLRRATTRTGLETESRYGRLGEEARAPDGGAREIAARRTGGGDSEAARPWRLQERRRQDHRSIPTDLVQLSQHPRFRSINCAGINRTNQLTATTPSGSKTTSPPK